MRWVMPSGDRLDKTIAQDDEDRMRMLEIIKTERFADSPRLQISDFELKLPRPTKTSSTVPALAKRFPNADFWFALGRDSYLSMPDWPDGHELQKNLRMVIFYSGLGAIITAGNVTTADLGTEYSDISSTKVRQALAAGQSLEDLVSEPIANYLTR